MADIVTFVPGDYTPGAETALRNAVSLINAAWSQANIKEAAYAGKIDAIEEWMPTASDPHVTAGVVIAPTVIEPNVTIPSSVEATDVMSMFDTKYLELVALLETKFTAFRNTHFPEDTTDYAQVEAWLTSSLASNSGLPAAVKAQLLTEDKDRVLAEVARASDAVLQQFAARRFPLPPGAAAGAVLQLQQKGQDAIADSARKITIASIEQLKWSAEKLIGLRQLAMSSAVEYIKALASGPDMASKLVGIGYDAQSKLIGAASQFYGVRADVAKIQSQSDQYNVSTALDAATKNQMADLTLIEDRLKAMLSEAQTLGQMTTSLFNNLHASAGTSYSVAA